MPRVATTRHSDEDTKPKKIPRPPNAWILYRTDRLRMWRATRSPNDAPMKQADISRFIASQWKSEPESCKLEYEKRAAIAKAEHKRKFPDYKYNPISKEAKDKIRAEEREAKKRAREEAKAAKAAGRKVSSNSRLGYRSASPSGSNVKLEAFDEAKPVPVPEPLNRGCGPSPPIDYDPEGSSTASSTPLPSSSSSASIRSSPLPPPSSHSLSNALDASNAWLQRVPSPASSSPTQPPPPAYPSTFVHSPVPSRHSSYNFTSALPQTALSTPADSPPSYSDGESWQPQSSEPQLQSFTPPHFQNDWGVFANYPPLHQPDTSFPMPALDPLLAGPENAQHFNTNATSPLTVFDLTAAQTLVNLTSGVTPLEMQQLLQQLAAAEADLLSQINQMDQVAPMLDLPEFHETVEDRADEAGIPAPTDMQPSTFEDFASFVNANSQDAMVMSDPTFYENMRVSLVNICPELFNIQPPPFSAHPYDSSAFVQTPAPAMDSSSYQTFPIDLNPSNSFDSYTLLQPNQGQMSLPPNQLAMPVPTVPVAVHAMSAASTPIEQDMSSHTPFSTHSAMSTPVESASASSRRYVPPSGAGLPPRRRVGGRYQPPRPAQFDDGSV